MIKVLVADDHHIVMDGICSLLDRAEGIEVVAKAENGKRVLNILISTTVDIAILDIEMPEMNGIETARKIRELYPNVKTLILSMYNTEEFIRALIEVEVSGYILKNRGVEELVEAINYIASGGEYFGKAVTKTLISSMKKPQKEIKDKVEITKRESEVLKLIAEGFSSPQIGDKLFIASSTVDTHRRNLIDKTGVRNSKELIRYAIQNGYI
ncbi:MAG: response regulator transcription factor [Cyclobacteriaceae bacterium]